VVIERFPRRHPDSAFRAIGDEGGMVVMPERAEVKVLNPVGIKIFALLDGEHSRDQIVEAVVAEFDVDAPQAAKELDVFLAELAAEGMLAQGETVSSEESP